MEAPYYRSNSETEGGTWPGDERKIGSNCHVKQNISHGFKFLLATENVYGWEKKGFGFFSIFFFWNFGAHYFLSYSSII